MRRNLYVTLFASFLLGAALSSGATAQEAPAPEPRDAADVRIIVDISGSMKDTDPENLRQPAVRLLARMLPDGAEAGVWTFGQYVNMLVPHGAVNEDWRARAIGRSADINSVALRTNLGEAIEVASEPSPRSRSRCRSRTLSLASSPRPHISSFLPSPAACFSRGGDGGPGHHSQD